IALHGYHGACRVFPPSQQGSRNWVASLLPFIDETALFETIVRKGLGTVTSTPLPLMICPSDSNNLTPYQETTNPNQFTPPIWRYYARGNYGSNACLAF